MNPDLSFRASGGRLAAGIALAVLLGILTPLAMALETLLIRPVILLSGLMMVFLFCYAGRLPAWLYMTVQLGSAAVVLGPTFMWMTMAAGTFPGILAMRGLMGKRPFFEQMKVDMGLYLLGLLTALLIAREAFGGNMIARASDMLVTQFNQLPDEWFSPFVEAVNQARAGSLTVADYREQVLAMVKLLGEAYERMLPGTLLSGALLSGLLTALWGNWLMARRGLATDQSYIPLTRWFLPRSATLGLGVIWIAAYLLSQSDYGAGESVYMAAYAVVSMAFLFQGLAAIDRFCYRRGMSLGRRRGFVVAAAVLSLLLGLFNTFIFLIGILSALFGSHGAIARRIDLGDGDKDE